MNNSVRTTVTALLVLPESLFAQYIDPGTGSYIFQLAVAGIMFMIFFFSKIKTELTRIFKGIIDAFKKSKT